MPPTKSGRPVWFLVVEDERGLLKATIRDTYERYGDLLHHRGAFLLEGRVENTPAKGFSFLVKRVEELREVLTKAGVPWPRVGTALGASYGPLGGARGRGRLAAADSPERRPPSSQTKSA